MPIRYTRVGWQDAPSTETPIDAANLNHMDNGILALSEEVDTELPLLRDQINDVSADIETQIDEKIPPEVSSWLTEHVTPAGSAVVVDDSLTITGAAADAKKTGDEISSLKEDYTTILDSAYVTDTASGSIASFPDGADGVPVKSLKVNIEPVQSGSGDPSPDNVRPISGHTSAVVTRMGVNVWDEEWELGYWENGIKTASANIRSANKIPINPNTTYYIKTPSQIYYTFYDSEGNFLPVTGYDAQGRLSMLSSGLVTTPSNAHFMTFNMGAGYGTTYNHDISINYPSTDHDYHAYNGQTHAIDLGQTVYGGTLDVTTGVLTVDRAIATLTGESITEIGTSSTGAKYIGGSLSPYGLSVNGISNQYVCVNSPVPQGGTGIRATGNGWYIYDDRFTDMETAKTLLNANPVQMVYTLTEPITLTLTGQELTTLKGQNNIGADTGDVEVTYRADTKLYIEKLTAPTEDDMIADHAISANSFFMVGNTLYRATTAIASGATITVGTNATKLSLSDALNTLS